MVIHLETAAVEFVVHDRNDLAREVTAGAYRDSRHALFHATQFLERDAFVVAEDEDGVLADLNSAQVFSFLVENVDVAAVFEVTFNELENRFLLNEATRCRFNFAVRL